MSVPELQVSPHRSLTVFHFVPARAPQLLDRLVERLPDAQVVPVLDAEDAVGDVLCPARTPALKNAARRHLERFLVSAEAGRRRRVAIRINGRSSPFHAADLAMVTRILAHRDDVSLMLPKVESAADVLSVVEHLHGQGLAIPPLLLLCETGEGHRQLSGILHECGSLVKGVALGMIDYAYDERWWPFPDSLSPRVWAIAREVAEATAKSGIDYIHTPCLRLRDRPVLHEIRRRLRGLVGHRCGVLSLSASQTEAYLDSDDVFSRGDVVSSPPDPEAEAWHVIERFHAQAGKRRSFVIDAETDRFIAPHEFLAARRFLSDIGSER